MNRTLIHTTARFACLVAIVTSLAGVTGCKSAADKCRDENQEIYAKAMSACKDDACKKAAAVDLKNYLAACDNMK